MENRTCSVEKVGFRYGLFLAGGLIGYFLLMQLLGLADILELRFLNLFILIAAVVGALKYYKKHCNTMMTYFKGMGVGIFTSMVGAVIFAFFMGVYLGVVAPGFYETIRNEWPAYATQLSPVTISFVVLLEGAISGFMTTFIAMQWYKVPHGENPTE